MDAEGDPPAPEGNEQPSAPGGNPSAPPPKKRRKKSSGISRKARGGSSKQHRDTAPVESFRGDGGDDAPVRQDHPAAPPPGEVGQDVQDHPRPRPGVAVQGQHLPGPVDFALEVPAPPPAVHAPGAVLAIENRQSVVSKSTLRGPKKARGKEKQREQRLKNQLQYRKRKGAKDRERVAELRHEVAGHAQKEAETTRLLQRKDDAVARAEAVAGKALERMAAQKDRFQSSRAKKEEELRGVRRQAKSRAAATEAHHAAQLAALVESNEREARRRDKALNSEVQRVKSSAFHDQKQLSKTVVSLQGELEKQQSLAAKSKAQLQREFAHELDNRDTAHAAKLREAERGHADQLKQVQSAAYKDGRAATKLMAQKEAQLTGVILQQDKALARMESAVVEAQSTASTLKVRAVDAERETAKATRDANRSAKRSKDVSATAEWYDGELKKASRENKTLAATVDHLQAMLEESDAKLVAAQEDKAAAVPIPVVQRERKGKTGNRSWGLDIWEVIIEQLVNGTPPASICSNMIALVRKFSPSTEIRELPSIWTVRRARTVVLVIVQALAAYRLGKAKRWGQLFTDETSRRQISFQNLVISVEEDELFR